MRVLTFLHSFESGGVERVALRLVGLWQARGIDAPLLMGRSDGPLAASLARGVRWEAPAQPAIGTSWWETLWMIARLPAVIRRLRPDALFCAGNSYTVVAVAMKLLLGRRCPPILAKISNDLRRLDLPLPARLAYRLWLIVQGAMIDRFVAVTSAARTEISALMHVPSHRIMLIPNPILDGHRLASLRRAAAHDDRPGRRFVAVGRLAPQKNHAMLLRAFAAASGPADSLAIFGDGPLRESLVAKADALGLGDHVCFHGHVEDIDRRLGAHDTLLLASDYEGMPGVVVEALAAGLRVIATNCCASMILLLDRGRLGTLVPVGDERAFAAAIADPALPVVDRAAAQAQAARFTVERAAPAYLSGFVSLAARRRDMPPRAAAIPSLALPLRGDPCA